MIQPQDHDKKIKDAAKEYMDKHGKSPIVWEDKK